MRSLPLTAATQAILARIKTYEWTLDVYGMSQSRAARLVKARTETRINKAGIGPPYNNVYRRYVLELVKTFRTRTRDPLAQAIPLVIRKWANLGLAIPLLEELLGDCFLRFEQHGYAMPKKGQPPHSDGTGTAFRRGKPCLYPIRSMRRRRRTTYENALKKGRARLRGGNTIEEQAELQRQGSVLASSIARRLKPILKAHGVSGRAIMPYYNFAQQLGKLSRNYGGRTLEIAAADLIDLGEAKGLDGAALRALARTLFGITVPP
jgi:hypothetical protein